MEGEMVVCSRRDRRTSCRRALGQQKGSPESSGTEASGTRAGEARQCGTDLVAEQEAGAQPVDEEEAEWGVNALHARAPS
jgi:hypothetical protein